MAQGFVATSNLAESVTPTSDRNILDNLGGVNITQDILLFDGNQNFESKLKNISSEGRADFIVFEDTTDNNYKTVKTNLLDNKFAFSNGTRISLDEGADLFPFVVVDSNGRDEFRLVEFTETYPYNAAEYIFPFAGADISNLVITRKDAITVENVTNLSRPRLLMIDVAEEGEDVGTAGADGDDDAGGFGGLSTEGLSIFDNFGTYDQIDYVASAIGRLTAKKSRSILTDRFSFFSENLRFKGTIRLTNDGQNQIYNNGSNAPGLFIYNTATGQEIRAFSGSDNPWEEALVSFDGTQRNALKTNSAKSQITNLVLDPDGGGSGNSDRGHRPKLIKKNDSGTVVDAILHIDGNAPSSQQITQGEYTHKVPVTINGEQFFMLVKEV
jgi:hypothetical protein